MFWAIMSSVFIIYLYRKLNSERTPTVENISTDNIQVALNAIETRITALEGKIDASGVVETRL